MWHYQGNDCSGWDEAAGEEWEEEEEEGEEQGNEEHSASGDGCEDEEEEEQAECEQAGSYEGRGAASWNEQGDDSEDEEEEEEEADEDYNYSEGEEEEEEEGEEEEAEEREEEQAECEQAGSHEGRGPATSVSHLFLSPQRIRFTQKNIGKAFQNNVTLDETIAQLASDCIRKRNITMIRVVMHRGQYYTLDNRRLAVFRLLGILGKVRVVKARIVEKTKEWSQKFQTRTDGTVVRVRGTDYTIGTDRSSTTYPLQDIRIPVVSQRKRQRSNRGGGQQDRKRARHRR